MGEGPRVSRAARVVLGAFLSDPDREMSAVEVCAAAGVPAGSLHPVLARLEGMGWLESRWEDLGPGQAQRGRRRCYRLTGVGATLAAAATAPRARAAPFQRWRPVTGQT